MAPAPSDWSCPLANAITSLQGETAWFPSSPAVMEHVIITKVEFPLPLSVLTGFSGCVELRGLVQCGVDSNKDCDVKYVKAMASA